MEVKSRQTLDYTQLEWKRDIGAFIGPKTYDPAVNLQTWEQVNPKLLKRLNITATPEGVDPWMRRDIIYTFESGKVVTGYSFSSRCGVNNEYTFSLIGDEKSPQLRLNIHTVGGIGPVSVSYSEDGFPDKINIEFSFAQSRRGKGILFTPDMTDNRYLLLPQQKRLEYLKDLIKVNSIGVLLPSSYFAKKRKEAFADLKNQVYDRIRSWPYPVRIAGMDGALAQSRQFVQEELKGDIKEGEIEECEMYLTWLILLQVPEYFNRLPSDQKEAGNAFSRGLSRAAAYALEYHRLHLRYKEQEEENDFAVDLWRSDKRNSYTLSYPITRVDGADTSVESLLTTDGEEVAAGMHTFYITPIKKDKYGLTDSLAVDVRLDDNESKGLQRGAQIVLPILNHWVVIDALKDPETSLKDLLAHVRPDFTRFK